MQQISNQTKLLPVEVVARLSMGTTFICLLIYLMTIFLKPVNLTLRFHEFAYEEKNEANHQTPLVEAGNIKELKTTNEMIL